MEGHRDTEIRDKLCFLEVLWLLAEMPEDAYSIAHAFRRNVVLVKTVYDFRSSQLVQHAVRQA